VKYIYKFLMDLCLKIYIHFYDAPLKKSEEELKNSAKNSILIFSNTALGDTLLSTPAIKSLRDSFPDARITLFIHKNIYPLMEGAEFADNFIVYHGGYKNFFSTVMQLRHVKADIALLLHSNGPQDVPMAIMSGTKTILKTPTKSAYRHYLSYEFSKKEQHTIEDRLDLVRAIGGEKLSTRMLLPSRYYVDSKREIFEADKKVIGFQPGAANIYKMWPAQNFKELAEMLLEDSNVVIGVSGSKRERKLGEIIKKANSTRVQNFCGEFAIEHLPKFIKEMDLLVTNDTGTMHIAIALGVPTVELFGATGAQHTGAYQDVGKHAIIQKKVNNEQSVVPKKIRSNNHMLDIFISDVITEIKRFM